MNTIFSLLVCSSEGCHSGILYKIIVMWLFTIVTYKYKFYKVSWQNNNGITAEEEEQGEEVEEATSDQEFTTA